MSGHIREMPRNGTLKEADCSMGFLSRLFLVPKGDGATRPILNLKRLNLFLATKSFRLINHQRIPSFLQRGDFMIKVDLSQAYFQVPVKEAHQRFLALSYEGKTLVMTCLPFGLASAPQAFSSLSNWVASLLRERGMRVVVYLDDFCLVHQSPLVLKVQGEQAVSLLQELGWLVNLSKSQLTPSQALQFLGLMWDPHQDLMWLPLDKQLVLKGILQHLLRLKLWNVETARSLLGHLSLASFVVPLGRLHSRRIQRAASRLRTCSPLLSSIPLSVLEEIGWWEKSLSLGSPIFPPPNQIHLDRCFGLFG
ncbi:uncharacterized protein LOC113471193 [Diaphorina citri]|uniref:Uncharacterized protein LOC113471193 n=1 Tax=Diaphorina citri TaxID=121845 RepID=A0A3Q0JBY1_DIACI|nr:uncharacterized protein LOC113471193 [Diaphorina citri]